VHANPFATSAEPTAALQPASRQPLAFAVAVGVATALSLLLGNLIALVKYPEYSVFTLENLLYQLPSWCFSILLGALVAALLSRGYLERHGSALVRPLTLLLGIGLALVVADLGYGFLYSWLFSGIHESLSDSAIPPLLVYELLGLLAFAITCLLPLWLGLHFAAKTPVAADYRPRREAALLLALCFSLLSLKMLLLLHFIYPHNGGWMSLIYATPLVYGALVFTCAWQALPARLARVRPGQLALAAMAIFLAWLLAQLLIGGLLVLSAFSGNDALLAPLPLTIVGVAVLALLWPLTLLGLRWVYRAEAAA
jgi:hypothetical protein